MKRKLNGNEIRGEKSAIPLNRWWLMFFLVFMSVCFPVFCNAQNEQRITVQLQNATIEQVIREIKQNSRYKFFYRVEDLPSDHRRDYVFKNATLQQVMQDMLKNSELEWSFNNGIVVISKKKMQVVTSSRKISGRVVDENEVPLPGVSVIIRGTTTGVATDAEGKFSLAVPSEETVLLITFIGKKDVEVTVGARTTLNIKLEDDKEILDEVVITGYQTLSKERATGAFAVVTANTLKSKLQTDVVHNLEGMIPGMLVQNGEVSIRGISTLNGDQSPLYVVDGFPWEGDISQLSADNIQNITVLKDAAAASIYGARSANGVIVITTKSGQMGKTHISVGANFFITPLPSVDRDLISSSELVDLQTDFFNAYGRSYELVKKDALPLAIDLLYQRQLGKIGTDEELEMRLNSLRRSDRTSQLKKLLLRRQFKQQYTLNISGGGERNTYFMSAEYLDDKQYDRGEGNRRININLKDNLKITPWLTTEITTMASFSKGTSSVIHGLNMLTSGASYELLVDEDGKTLAWNYGKSQEEKDRLQALGLKGERYNPLDEKANTNFYNNSFFLRLGVALNARLTKGVDVSVMYQTGKESLTDREVYAAEAYTVENMINNAAQIDSNGKIVYNIPQGGQLMETRGVSSSYTLRGQLTIDRTFAERHSLTALFGAERRRIWSEQTNAWRMGYDDRGLTWAMIDAKKLSSGLKGTEATNGMFSLYGYDSKNGFNAAEDRFVSFFGNLGYTYDGRYSLTGSVRVDESNLFGTDPKYRHAPLWSAGFSWNLGNEHFMKNVISGADRLILRATYGINGNVAKNTGPYIIVQSGYDAEAEANYNKIMSPPNDQLRWEKTRTINVGTDVSVLSNRIALSLDYYWKKSTDLLGYIPMDPTLGWESVMVNYGAMKNRGVEIALNSLNINKADFRWRTSFVFSHNKNKLTHSTSQNDAVWNYLGGGNIQGYPLNPLFSYNYAGLSDTGHPLIYDENGEKATAVSDKKALIYGGSRTPKYTGSFTNTFNWRNFELSLMFIFNGGHVMRNFSVPYITNYESITSNVSSDVLNRWRQAGDENKENVTPAFDFDAPYTTAQLWSNRHTSVVKADYLRLRNISLSYDLPKKYLKTFRMSEAQLHFQVQNSFLWTANGQKIDPESGSQFYNLRPTWLCGIHVKF